MSSRGRRPGTLVAGSVQSQIANMKVGESLWVETTKENYAAVQRQYNIPHSRRIPELRDVVIKCTLWQAVHVGQLDEVVVLVKVERTK